MSFDVLQRPVDANSQRVANLGAPTTSHDATYTDNVSTPTPIGTGAPGSSLVAAALDHTHTGLHSINSTANPQITGDATLAAGSGIALSQSGNTITISGAAGTVNKITWAEDGQTYVVGNTEQIVREYNINFDDAGAVGNIQARLTGLTKVSAGTGTYRLYIGASAPGSTTGGTVRATFTQTATSDTQTTNIGAGFTNPTGQQLVQITLVNSGGSNNTFLRGFSVSIG